MNNGLTPSYLSDLVKLWIPLWAQRSQNTGLQVVPIVPLLLILQVSSVSGPLSAGPTFLVWLFWPHLYLDSCPLGSIYVLSRNIVL